ncbi:MAG: c-type cytochrome [Bacteroidia bacterium]
MIRKTTYTLALGLAALAMLSSCGKSDPNSPGYEFMPDMYRGTGPETNVGFNNPYVKDSMGNLLPAEGSVPRNFIVFPYPNTPQGDTLASKFWDIPADMKRDDAFYAQGEALYTRNCVYCHGAKGDGNGKLVETEKYASVPPNYETKMKEGALSIGHIYHVVTYGKGVMGSHAVQLNPEERFMVAAYVQKLGRGGKSEAEYTAANKPAADTAVTKKP